jgi:hypothetical protein
MSGAVTMPNRRSRAPGGPCGAAYFGRGETHWQTPRRVIVGDFERVGKVKFPREPVRAGLQAFFRPPGCRPEPGVDISRYGVIVNYNTTSSSTEQELVMQTRLVPILLLAAMLYALGASIASVSSMPEAPVKAHARAAVAAAAIPVLPTVVVRPEAVADREGLPAMLPLVTVRPSAGELAAARSIGINAGGETVIALHSMGGAQRSGLDMPYYSFGRSSYRLRKE